MDEDDQEAKVNISSFDEGKVDLAELKQGPSYVCKVLALSNGKNLVEPEKNNKFPKRNCQRNQQLIMTC